MLEASSNPAFCTSYVCLDFAELTQLGECLPYKQGVSGSSPLFRTKVTYSKLKVKFSKVEFGLI